MVKFNLFTGDLSFDRHSTLLTVCERTDSCLPDWSRHLPPVLQLGINYFSICIQYRDIYSFVALGVWPYRLNRQTTCFARGGLAFHEGFEARGSIELKIQLDQETGKSDNHLSLAVT